MMAKAPPELTREVTVAPIVETLEADLTTSPSTGALLTQVDPESTVSLGQLVQFVGVREHVKHKLEQSI